MGLVTYERENHVLIDWKQQLMANLSQERIRLQFANHCYNLETICKIQATNKHKV